MNTLLDNVPDYFIKENETLWISNDEVWGVIKYYTFESLGLYNQDKNGIYQYVGLDFESWIELMNYIQEVSIHIK